MVSEPSSKESLQSVYTREIIYWMVNYFRMVFLPWIVSSLQRDTAFAGIGYSVNHNSKGSHILVGCSHIYSHDGQGMKYKLSKINNFTLDSRKNPYLSEDEAYKLGINIKDLFYKSFTEIPKRGVIHKRTPFRSDEINGLVQSLSAAGIKDINLLEVSYEEELTSYALKNDGTLDGYPIKRGFCFAVDDCTMFLYTHGIAPSVLNPNFKYIQGRKQYRSL